MGAPLDNRQAAAYGSIVAAAYATFAADPGSLTPAPTAVPIGWTPIAWIQMSDFLGGSTDPKFYGLVVQHEDAFVVAIRGTQGWTEWLDDADIFMTPFTRVPSAGRVASGFDRIYSTLKTVPIRAGVVADAAAPSGSFAEQVAQLVAASSPQPQGLAMAKSSVVIAGHSLGAALCTLYALENATKKLVANPLVCTFASPRVGDAAFATAFNDLRLTSWRIVNKPDVVPNLPPDIFGYVHVNELSLFDSTGKVKTTLACAHELSTYLYLVDSSVQPSADCQATPRDTAIAAAFSPEATAMPIADGDSTVAVAKRQTVTITLTVNGCEDKL